MQRVEQGLREARRLLRVFGWAQGAGDPRRRCLGRALVEAMTPATGAEFQEARLMLGFASQGDLIEWNDRPGRKVEEVFARLDRAILHAGEWEWLISARSSYEAGSHQAGFVSPSSS